MLPKLIGEFSTPPPGNIDTIFRTIIQAGSRRGVVDFPVITISSGIVEISRVTVRYGVEESLLGTITGGGGIKILGNANVTIIDSSITANDASNGGGIRNSGQLKLIGSTVNDNLVTAPVPRGAGVRNLGTMEVINSTISGNTFLWDILSPGVNPGGGGIENSGSMTVINSNIINNEIAGSGGGIRGGGTFANTIVANNISTFFSPDCNASINSLGNNLIGNLIFCSVSGNTDGDILGVDISRKIGNLTPNGGPTLTHGLIPGNPATHAGNDDEAPTIDQRGFPRPLGPATDIGSFEGLDPGVLPVIDGIAGNIDGTDIGGAFTDESGFYSDHFTDQHLGGTTSGSVRLRGQLDVEIEDALLSTDGVQINVSEPSTSSGNSIVDACSGLIRLTDADSAIITCGSLNMKVLVGPIDVLLASNLEASIPGGSIVTISEVKGGVFEIENTPQSAGSVIVEINSQQITIEPGNTEVVSVSTPPVADAGPDQPVTATESSGVTISLDGTGSSDPDNDPLTFSWVAPGITFDDPTSPIPTATFPLGTTIVTLVVNDGAVDSVPDTVEITVVNLATCPDDVLISNYQVDPSNDQFVEVADIGATAINVGGCSLVTFNVFTETSIGAATVALSGILNPAETMQVYFAGALPAGPAAIGIYDVAPLPADGTPFSTTEEITGMVYLNNSSLQGAGHLRVPAHNAIYTCIYGSTPQGNFPFRTLASCLP